MNIHEAAKSGRPFRNPSMIGAWMVVDGHIIHRDNISDFSNINWIRQNCIHKDTDRLYWMDVGDLLRTDWETIEPPEATRTHPNR